MDRAQARFIALAVASSLVLAGCYTYEPISMEQFRNNPNLIRNGDTVMLHTSTEGTLKGKVLERSEKNIYLKGGKGVPIEEIVAMKVQRLSVWKTLGMVGLIAMGVAALVGGIWGLGHVMGAIASTSNVLSPSVMCFPNPGPGWRTVGRLDVDDMDIGVLTGCL